MPSLLFKIEYDFFDKSWKIYHQSDLQNEMTNDLNLLDPLIEHMLVSNMHGCLIVIIISIDREEPTPISHRRG